MANNNLMLLFERPFEPIFTPRNNGETAFELPENFFTDRYKGIGQQIQNRFGGDDVKNKVTLHPIEQPDYAFASGLSRKVGFSLFNQNHRDIAGEVIKIFMGMPDLKSFISAAAYAKDRLNPYMFQYALAVASAHRPDTKDLHTPTIVQVFPAQFVDPIVFKRLREEGTLVEAANRRAVEIPQNFTASDREQEQRLAYFREDIGVNMHHWHWHLVYPGSGTPEIVNKDRRGELFYYMHSQIIARYNLERFCNSLPRVKRLSHFREEIPEGYFPKIIRSSNNRAYPPRVSKSLLSDVNRDDTAVEIADLERWRDRIFEAIDQGFIIDTSGNRVPLTIDILGNIIESASSSPNPKLYGSLHNEGHNVISFVHDPDNRHLEDYGVMGDVTTAMRDPIFYRWHGFIDSIFTKYKDTLPQYTPQQLGYDGVTINSINLQLTRGQNTPPNVLLTFWQRSQVDLAAGLDFGPQGNIFAQFTHLQHAAFTYRIVANNAGKTARRGTCRIFIAPRMDERGTPLTFRDQRALMVEMDKFNVNLNPGANTILRRSDESSITIPFERSFRAVGSAAQPTEANALAQFRFCGCGWPQHMLLPKGTAAGLQLDVFVMISDFAGDTVNQTYDPNVGCNDAASFCGIRDQLYPDKRDMGYPFDRITRHDKATLKDFVASSKNMGLGQVTVRFSNTYVNKT